MPCNPFDNCAEFVNEIRAIVVCSDRNSSTNYRYNNTSRNRLTKYTVDGCLITIEERCDYLLINCNQLKSFFIELKGSDLSKAIDQIDSSITRLKPTLINYSVNARIVLTRVNTVDLKSAKFLKFEKRVQSLGGNVIKRSRLLEENG